MVNVYQITQMLRLLHAPICVYNTTGEVVKTFEDITGQMLIDKLEFKKEICRDFPYINIDKDGLAYCLMWIEEESHYLGLGMLRIYSIANETASTFPYCKKNEFLSIIAILWNMLTDQEVSLSELSFKNVVIDYKIEEEITHDIFAFQEEGRRHNPYSQEMRECDSIRRGDLKALQQSIDEVYSGEIGVLSKDTVRSYKNIAICVISLAARCAIDGGVTPELAFSMSDTFIRNIEDNLTEPIKIEKATRDAEFEYARMVHELKEIKNNNPLVDQVRDYVFCHIHDAILVREIAEYVGVTPNYLSEQFSQSMGMTLKQYIINEKIISSENLLKYTDYSLQEISSFCAFSSQSRFSVYFQRKNKITPAKYRKKYKKGRNE